MTLCCSDNDKKRLKTRLNRIEGQIRGITKMLDENRDCIEILNQIISTQSALKGVWKQVIKDHLMIHISQALINHKHGEELVDELVEHLERIK